MQRGRERGKGRAGERKREGSWQRLRKCSKLDLVVFWLTPKKCWDLPVGQHARVYVCVSGSRLGAKLLRNRTVSCYTLGHASSLTHSHARAHTHTQCLTVALARIRSACTGEVVNCKRGLCGSTRTKKTTRACM